MSKQKSNFLGKSPSLSPALPQKPRPLKAPSQQLIDSLTSHISLYSSKLPSHNPNPNPHPRSSIVKWFSSLSPHQRQSHLTALDPGFVRILLQMLAHVKDRGCGTFIILPDLPSPDNLPSLCYRQSRGLLSRVAESDGPEARLFESILLFSSKEGDNVKECSVSVGCLDSLTVGEELVGNFDLFVETMDGISNGGFLRGEVGELGDDWVELPWLKEKGLEVALRLAWMSCNNGKKRGVRLKEKICTANVSANLFWRKKACLDWWQSLDGETRSRSFTMVMGKSAKKLVLLGNFLASIGFGIVNDPSMPNILEILNESDKAPEDKLWTSWGEFSHPLTYGQKASSSQRSGKKILVDEGFSSTTSRGFVPQKHLAYYCDSLYVLQDGITFILSCFHNFGIDLLFFSTLGSLGTLADSILRKFRGFLMVIYLDCTKLELLGEQSCSSLPNKDKEKSGLHNKVKEKSGSTIRRKKAKSQNLKRVNPIASLSQDFSPSQCDKFHEKLDISSCCDNTSMELESTKMQRKMNQEEKTSSSPLSSVQLETMRGTATGVVQNASKKKKKGKCRSGNTVVKVANEFKETKNSSVGVASSSCISQEETADFGLVLDKTDLSNNKKDDLRGKNDVALVSSACNINLGLIRDGAASESCKGDLSVGSTDDISCTISEFSQPTLAIDILSCLESSKSKVTDSHSFQEIDPVQKLKNMGRRNPESAHPNKKGLVSDKKGAVKGDERSKFGDQTVYDSSSVCQSQEWPSVASYFPSPNSHLPPAADRLHLDVGRNWQNHFCQPFLSTIHKKRNPSMENSCKQILARPLPMSLDWPPAVQGSCSLASSIACNYDPGIMTRRQSQFTQGFSSHSMHINIVSNNDEKYSGDFLDKSELMNMQDFVDDCDGQWISEEELEVHGVSGLDCNQYFGGGIMYWNPSDHPGTGFSRPPSLSSDDSFWAWKEADMNRVVDDMVAFSSSYSTNGLASPTAASYCSPFDPLNPGHQALGYVMAGGEVPVLTDSAGEAETVGSLTSITADVDGKTGDSLPYPVLQPIIIPNIKREIPNLKSPGIPPGRREKSRIKRPPSPVVLCVPRAPRPPPPSPVGDARKHRGFPTVRSGSSSPRHWGMRGWHIDSSNNNPEEGCVRMDGAEVVLPSWRNNNLSTHTMIQPLPGSLLQDRLIAIAQLARDQEHPDVTFPLQPPDQQNCPMLKAPLSLLHSILHDEIDAFWKQVVSENLSRKPYINWAVKRVTRSLQVLWPRSRTNIFGSVTTGLALPTSDVDLVVCLPPVRNLEPIKEAGILEGRNGIKETCLQHAARYLANQEWVKNDSLKTVENTAIPIIMLEVEVPHDLITSNASRVQSPKGDTLQINSEDCNHVDFQVGESEKSATPRDSQTSYECRIDLKTVRLDISFKSTSHTGLQTTELVRRLTDQFPAAMPLALLLKKFLAFRGLDQSYSGGLSSYCLVLLITRFLQHEHHLGRSVNQNFGSLLMDFLYFFGNVFDPRQMRVSVRGSGLYVTRERGHSIDPIHIDDPLYPTNNVGRNCFRIHQCIKAFSEAYSLLEQELTCISDVGNNDTCSKPLYSLLQKIIPNIGQV
ncbi:hypothetical protein SAY87_023348 [Trapa incisa]|uniref:Polymerase nucleotidyl transferase domain-containing protein n=1 Tax=Trapa incisa TaxID=236973 RepID=A0AAN7Q668_9MYRT|nr:hypothetical protein SAY87_023348 [Trapa incisa]